MTATPQKPRTYPVSSWTNGIGYLIFFSRWLQAPLYLGLIVAQAIYVVVFLKELWHLVEGVFIDSAHPLTEADIMLIVLGLIDVVMIANLLIMVIIGGYETFVSKIKVDDHPDQPEWLSHVNANVLKVKLAMAIIGISSIHLLKTFIEVGGMTDAGTSEGGEKYTPTGVMWQVIIHCVFILSALALAWIDRMSYRGPHAGAAHGAPTHSAPTHSAPTHSGAPGVPILHAGESREPAGHERSEAPAPVR